MECVRTLNDLPLFPLELVISFLPDNEVSCTVRLISKRMSETFRDKVKVRLSQPSPRHSYARQWGGFLNPAVRNLTFKQRQRLLCLTARSGSLANLEIAVATVGCTLTQEVLDAAAEGGHLDICRWLIANGCVIENCALPAVKAAAKAGHLDVVIFLLRQRPGNVVPTWIAAEAWAAAAGVGNQALCEGLLAVGITCVTGDVEEYYVDDDESGDSFSDEFDYIDEDEEHIWARRVVIAAARGGHVGLTDWLLRLPGFARARRDPDLLLVAVYNFDVASLLHLYDGRPRILRHVEVGYVNGAIVTAVCGPTPDWRAKVEWLQATFGDVDPAALILATEACANKSSIAKRPDAIQRLELLRQMRRLWGLDGVPEAAVHSNNLAVLRYLHDQGLFDEHDGKEALRQAAEDGNVAALAELVALGCRIGKHVTLTAARHGHLHVLRWLAGPEAGPSGGQALRAVLEKGAELAVAGAESGSLELMQWLWERGCLWDELVSYKIAESGSLELMQWVRARGCPWDTRTFCSAAESGSVEKVEWLAALGCPWDERAFTAAARVGCWLLLERLVALGCPMGITGAAYVAAGMNGDLSTLRCLRALGCPWDPSGATFSGAVYPNYDYDGQRSSPLAVLRWLHDEGCPVDWQVGQKRATRRLDFSLSRDRGRASDVLDWIESQTPKGPEVARLSEA